MLTLSGPFTPSIRGSMPHLQLQSDGIPRTCTMMEMSVFFVFLRRRSNPLMRICSPGTYQHLPSQSNCTTHSSRGSQSVRSRLPPPRSPSSNSLMPASIPTHILLPVLNTRSLQAQLRRSRMDSLTSPPITRRRMGDLQNSITRALVNP